MEGACPEVLCRLANLLREHNQVTSRIAALIGRPAHPGHVGEFIASAVFDIALELSATAKGIDGRFRSGNLAGKSVNVKFYPRNAGLLDMNPEGVPNYYLVLAGPWSQPTSSRGTTAPWVVTHVFLFDGQVLLARLRDRGVKIGIATSVVRALWKGAEVYPVQRSPLLQLESWQREALGLFSGYSGHA